jgi:tetratricopeptide (TPR) repeat protein
LTAQVSSPGMLVIAPVRIVTAAAAGVLFFVSVQLGLTMGFVERARACLVGKRYEQAASYLHVVDWVGRESTPLLMTKANLADASGRADEAEQWLQRAVEASPYDERPPMRLAWWYATRKGDRHAAARTLLAALTRSPTNVSTWYLLARHLQATGDLPHAEAALQTALQLEPNFLRARDDLARVYTALGRAGEAAQARAALAIARRHLNGVVSENDYSAEIVAPPDE